VGDGGGGAEGQADGLWYDGMLEMSVAPLIGMVEKGGFE